MKLRIDPVVRGSTVDMSNTREAGLLNEVYCPRFGLDLEISSLEEVAGKVVLGVYGVER